MKKIFDEVFDTTKYTKALNELRLVAKKYAKYAKEFKHELELNAKTYEQYRDIRRKINAQESFMKELASKSSVLEQEKNELE